MWKFKGITMCSYSIISEYFGEIMRHHELWRNKLWFWTRLWHLVNDKNNKNRWWYLQIKGSQTFAHLEKIKVLTWLLYTYTPLSAVSFSAFHKVSYYRKSHNQTNTSFELSSQIEFPRKIKDIFKRWKIKDIFKRWKNKVQKFIFEISP